MTGLSPITASPPSALNNVKLGGLIPSAKEPYHRVLAFGRTDDVSFETFFLGARSGSKGLERIGARGLRDHMQKRGWIG